MWVSLIVHKRVLFILLPYVTIPVAVVAKRLIFVTTFILSYKNKSCS
jgi:hypothetical protein